MASIYRFSFEHDIIPNGVTIVTGSIWSGQGRFGGMTNALTATTRDTGSAVQAEIDVSVPTNSTGIRSSYYTKASDNLLYPVTLADAGPYSFRLINSTTSEIRFNNVQEVVQDVTLVEDNRWNLIRFSVDFDGTHSSGSLEFNGIRVDITKPDTTVGISAINLKGLRGTLSCIDDVGINDNTGTIDEDKGVPNAIKGFVGGLVENGDIQNWQQNVASLFPLSYNHESQGNFTYVPPTNKVITCNNSSVTLTVAQNKFTVMDPMSHVTQSSFIEEQLAYTESYYPALVVGGPNVYVTASAETTTSFNIQSSVYSDADGKVYFFGSSQVTYNPVTKVVSSGAPGGFYYSIGTPVTRNEFAYKSYDPVTNTATGVTIWKGDFDLTAPQWQGTPIGASTVGYEYRFRDVLASVYCPRTSKIYSLVSIYNPYYPHTTTQANQSYEDDYIENRSWIHMIVLDTKLNQVELSYKYYGTWTHHASEASTYVAPQATMVWNQSDQTIYAFCQKFNTDSYNSWLIRSIEPESLTINKNKAPRIEDTFGLSNTASCDMVYSDINNTMYFTLWTTTYGTSNIYGIDLTSRVGNIVFPNGIGSTIKKLVYTPARNAIFALGEVESFAFDPVKSRVGQDIYKQYGATSSQWITYSESGSLLSGSIIEAVPLFNINEAVYSPKNSAIIACSDRKIYSLKGSMESSVVNALLSPDSLKAGATASGDICTLKIAKPTGSFTEQYQYEGFNIRIDNASSLATASLKVGIREANVNYTLGDAVVTWANSTGSHVRSVFTPHNSGSSKWSASQFEAVQFYMEAGD